MFADDTDLADLELEVFHIKSICQTAAISRIAMRIILKH